MPSRAHAFVLGYLKLHGVPYRAILLRFLASSHIYQHPGGEDFKDFRARFPVNFHLETDDSSLPCGKSCKLPDELMPTNHINYENRVMDVQDDLPKYTAFGPPFVEGERLNNDGSKYEG